MSKQLRIASMVTGKLTTPQPPGIIYAPIDLAIALTTGLQQRGHQVSYFAPNGSHLPAGKLETCDLPPLQQAPEAVDIIDSLNDENRLGRLQQNWDQALIAHMLRRAEQGEYDILHIHPIAAGLPLGLSHPNIPIVYTLHDPIVPWRKMLYEQFTSPNQWLVSISQTQRQPAPDLHYAATIYNGIDLESFPVSASPGEYLLFIGRIHPDKGIREAIKIAELTGEKLIIVGAIEPEWQEFWNQDIEPHLNDKIKYLGFVERSKLYQHYQQAKAFLMPILWEEPFGLVMAEAMACGTPVIAFRRGSVPEVVVDGQTGFIVDTVEEMAAAVKKIDTIDRHACRQHVEEHFSIEKMVDSYEAAYYKILGLN